MKAFKVVLLVVVGLQGSIFRADPSTDAKASVYAPAACITVAAHESGTCKGLERNWETSYGSSDKDSYRTKALDIEVRNISRFPGGECKVTAYWTGKRTDGTKELFVHHAEVLPVSVLGAANAKVRLWCPLIASNTTVYRALGERTDEGAKIHGWFVIVTRDGEVVNSVASSPTYQRLLTSPAETQELLARYRPTGRASTPEMPRWRVDPARMDWRSRNSSISR